MLGFWLVVIRPLGPNLAGIPGDLGDVRFVNYVLEHFFRWVSGLEKDFWTAPLFYPFPLTLAFSDNLLGSAPLYALLRWAGLDRETAYQGWYIFSFALNYLAVAIVLSRLKLNGLAAAAGAFYFTFGPPILAQTNHPQLLYRFAVPVAAYALWRFAQTPRLRYLLLTVAALVMQFYLSVYSGIFLGMLLAAMIFLLLVCLPGLSLSARIQFWPRQFYQAWRSETNSSRFYSLIAALGLGAALVWLFWPYMQVSNLYGFVRRWDAIASLLPRWRSYLIADSSPLWHSISAKVSGIPMRHEHQLFPGIAVLLALAALPFFLKPSDRSTRAHIWAQLGSAGLLVALTLYVNGTSLYRLIESLPGLSSIRAVSRIILVLMYPLAMLIAVCIDRLTRIKSAWRAISIPFTLIVFAVLVAEPSLYQHMIFSKAAAQARTTRLSQQVPKQLAPTQFLYFNRQPDQPDYVSELDAMIVGQNLGLPVVNGYSGNFPPGYSPADSCAKLPRRILSYMNFAHINDSQYYFETMQRAVPIAFDDCDPLWWQKQPVITRFAGPIPAEAFSQLDLKAETIGITPYGIRAKLVITNHAVQALPAGSTTGNPISLSWRLVNLTENVPAPGFDTRKSLDLDLRPEEPSLAMLSVAAPQAAGLYRLEVSAVQEGVAWFHENGMPIATFHQLIKIDANQPPAVVDNPQP